MNPHRIHDVHDVHLTNQATPAIKGATIPDKLEDALQVLDGVGLHSGVRCLLVQ